MKFLKKSLGQNFLVDKNIINKIINCSVFQNRDIVEIGPGKGALTDLLVSRCPGMQALEVDRELVDFLKIRYSSYKDFLVHEKDALKTDYGHFKFADKVRIVGNLPYNISTPLLFHIISQI